MAFKFGRTRFPRLRSISAASRWPARNSRSWPIASIRLVLAAWLALPAWHSATSSRTGPLYNQAARDDAYARPVLRAAATFGLPVFGLPGSRLQVLGGDRVIAEGFADRRYRSDGSLVPRSEPGAFVESPEAAVQQVEWLIRERGVQTVCVHGDNPAAVEFVRELHFALRRQGFEIRACA